MLVTQPMKIETSPGKIEMAILHVAELDQTTQADQRYVAMLQRSPIHTMLFSKAGSLITANKAAMSKIHKLMEGEYMRACHNPLFPDLHLEPDSRHNA